MLELIFMINLWKKQVKKEGKTGGSPVLFCKKKHRGWKGILLKIRQKQIKICRLKRNPSKWGENKRNDEILHAF